MDTTANPQDCAEPIELIAIDLDGTLLTDERRITPRCATAVAAARKRGIHIVLASARPPRSVRPCYDELQLDTPQINYNGALIQDPRTGRVLEHRPLDAKLTAAIIDFARSIDPHLAVSIEILDRWYTDRLDPELMTETAQTMEPDYIGPLEPILNQPITKLMLLAPADRLRPVHDAVVQRFAGQIALAVSDEHLIQIMEQSVDKASALTRIADDYAVPASRVMAIGDAPNDIPMLRWAHLGIAVANAWPEVLAAADATVASNNDDGVAEAIERFARVR